MSPADWIDSLGEGEVLAMGGGMIGALFGLFAQRSRFCLRAATIEFWHMKPGLKLIVWLLAFGTAIVGIQLQSVLGVLDYSNARQMANRGSLSGAALGGLIFGAGMVLARGCASRLLVLSATGNLRALLSGLIFAIAAQSSLSGALAPVRTALSTGLIVSGENSRDLLAIFGLSHGTGLAIGLVTLALALTLTKQRHGAVRLDRWSWIGSSGCGLMVAAAWGFSQWVANNAFGPVQIQGLTFSGPSAEWLMRVLQSPAPRMSFEYGLIPGVFLGSLMGALISREFQIEGFKDGYSMRRYIAGAVLMGFGSILAGGCAVGAGITGGGIFAITAWIALIGMWLGAGVTDALIDRQSGHP
ncbi:MAG: YeeE/YedE family protein [Betaproteobacteria bacterium]|jgi:uncharacterized membrane protein YedE/YeeE|nr:YeeE/YedE family protein [Betaproteobacteria bacterium]